MRKSPSAWNLGTNQMVGLSFLPGRWDSVPPPEPVLLGWKLISHASARRWGCGSLRAAFF